jgi:hypothetical protein
MTTMLVCATSVWRVLQMAIRSRDAKRDTG